MVGIIDKSGNLLVSYTYDAWGNILSVTGSMASTLGRLNPLTYRGYVYDWETGLYYLQTRYYNPQWCRFLNADSFVSTGQGFVGNNMFAYCNNNPVNYMDSSGSYPVLGGLNLPPEGGTPVVIDGVIYYYTFALNGHGDLYEYWYDANGNLVRVRHHSNHGNAKKHKIPHDHPGEKDDDGNNRPSKKKEEVDNSFQAPKESTNVSDNAEAIGYAAVGLAVGYGIYQVAKWAIATFLAPVSGGSSFAVVALMP